MRVFIALLFVGFLTFPAFSSEPEIEGRYPARHFLSPSFKKVVDYPRAKKRAPQSASSRRSPVKQAKPVVVSSGPPSGCPSRAWCGCFLAKHLGLSDRALWVARRWALIGSAASGPAPGVVVVWRHHVGVVRYATRPGYAVILSGNDGRAVRERERSLRGVIAYRHVGARYASR